jgi:hypothetical protein
MIVLDYFKFDEHKVYLLTHRIKNTKDFVILDEYMQKGSRYYDDSRIAKLVLGYIAEQTKNGYDFNLEKANEKFLSLSSIDIDPYIVDAVKEAAACDYHYDGHNMEKQW